jgi:hypothetical protein
MCIEKLQIKLSIYLYRLNLEIKDKNKIIFKKEKDRCRMVQE